MILPPSPHALRLVRSTLGWLPGTAKFEPVWAGRHQRVFKVSAPGANAVALKEYAPDFRTTGTLQREFGALQLLPRHGLENIPKALHQDADHGAAIYEWMEGAAISPTERGEEVFDPIVDFLTSCARIPATEFPVWAPRAVRSGMILESRLRERIANLPREHAPLREWLESVLEPCLEEFLRTSRTLSQGRLDWEADLDPQCAILAPTHLGFSELLETPTRQIVFLNFTGFGQDDPASVLANLLLQSLETATPDQKTRLVPNFLGRFGTDTLLGTRFSAWFPLVGLEIVLDRLDPFVPLERSLRDFAGLSIRAREEALAQALGQAQRLLESLRKEIPPI